MSLKKVQALAARIVDLNDSIAEIDRGFEAVLLKHYGPERLAQIQEARAQAVADKTVLEEQIKAAAREEAVVGKNVQLIDRDEIKVSVSGTKPLVTYDAEKAMTTWPDDLVDETVKYAVDPKLIQARIELGLPADVLAKIEDARIEVAQTPKVTIKVAPSKAPASAKLPKTGTHG